MSIKSKFYLNFKVDPLLFIVSNYSKTYLKEEIKYLRMVIINKKYCLSSNMNCQSQTNFFLNEEPLLRRTKLLISIVKVGNYRQRIV